MLSRRGFSFSFPDPIWALSKFYPFRLWLRPFPCSLVISLPFAPVRLCLSPFFLILHFLRLFPNFFTKHAKTKFYRANRSANSRFIGIKCVRLIPNISHLPQMCITYTRLIPTVCNQRCESVVWPGHFVWSWPSRHMMVVRSFFSFVIRQKANFIQLKITSNPKIFNLLYFKDKFYFMFWYKLNFLYIIQK